MPFEQSEHTVRDQAESCTFKTIDPDTRLGVLAITVKGTSNPDAVYKGLRELVSDQEQELTVAGHRSLMFGSTQVHVVTQKHEVSVSLGGLPRANAADHRDAVIKIAETVISRL